MSLSTHLIDMCEGIGSWDTGWTEYDTQGKNNSMQKNLNLSIKSIIYLSTYLPTYLSVYL
jgi:hypothetical protein